MILEQFGAQVIKFVVSMRCLDEGVDLPDARIAYILASSSDPRQWVQRRGRILRLPTNQEVKTAEIIDFVTLPSTSSGINESIKNLVQSEVDRVLEFGDDSLSIAGARVLADELINEFNLENNG